MMLADVAILAADEAERLAIITESADEERRGWGAETSPGGAGGREGA
jgi:hypothetical protein